jgi:coiled-coil domain-containing protein 77
MSSKGAKGEKSFVSSGNLPTINERLGYLRPSRELLEYYRKKIGEYDIEREDLIKRLDKFKEVLDDQVSLLLSTM